MFTKNTAQKIYGITAKINVGAMDISINLFFSSGFVE